MQAAAEELPDRTFSRYLSGEELYGNAFDADEIRDWYEDEQSAYLELAPCAVFVVAERRGDD